MFILIKQVLKSLKQSATIIIALIFISIITVFISFSGLYINSNISDSLNKVRTEGNSSDVIIEKRYNDSNIEYKYDFVPDSQQSLFVSNYVYDTNNLNNNIIFPYSSSDFNAPNINELWTLPEADRPVYYDQYLPRYINRKKGINRGLSASLGGVLSGNGAAQNINTSNISTWLGIGYSMTGKNKEKLFDPQYLLFSGNDATNKKLVGYFDAGNISSLITANETAYIPNKTNFVSTDIGVAKTPLINLHKDIIRGISLDKNFASPYYDLYSDFVNVLTENTKFDLELTNVYNIDFDETSLSGIDKMVWERMKEISDPNYPTLSGKTLTDKEKELILIFNNWKLSSTTVGLPIRQIWIDEYNLANSIVDPTNTEAIEFFIANRVSQLKKVFKNFSLEHREYFIQNFLLSKGYEFNNNRSFSFYDRDTKKNLLIAEKDSNINIINNKPNDWINKLILSGNSIPFLSSANFANFLNFNANYASSILPIISPTIDDYARLFYGHTKGITHFLLNSTLEDQSDKILGIFNEIKPTLVYLNESIKFDNNGQIIIPQSTNSSAPNYLIPGMIEKMFAWIRLDIWMPTSSYNNYSVHLLFKEGVSTITSSSAAFIPNYSSYQTVVTEKFLNEFNKEIIPKSIWNDLITYNNYHDFKTFFNSISSKYKISIGDNIFLITGSGISPELAYPSPSLSSIIINPTNDILLYLDKFAFEMVRNSFVPSAENNYIAIDIKSSTGYRSIDKLNEELMPFMNDGTEKVAFSISNIFSADSILSLRYSFPDIIQSYISIFSIVAVVILVIVGLYLSFIIMKKYIDKNRVQLALFKANGFSTLKLSLGLSSISVIVAVIGGSLGYIIAYFLQSLIYSIVSPYMFISVLPHVFSPVGFLASIFIIAILFFSFMYVNLYFLFKKPLNLIIAQNIEVKSNRFLNILKYQKLPLTANLKFKFAISLSNIPRTFFYLTSCFMGITVISFGLSFVSKFNESQLLTDMNKHYVYSIDLQSPNEQGGLLKLQDYSQIGISDASVGIKSIYPETLVNGPFPYLPTELIVRNADGTQKYNDRNEPLYFSNIILPSYELYQTFDDDIDIFRNVVFSKWLLDFDIDVLGQKINIWNTVKSSFPLDFINKIELENQVFLNAILKTPIIGDEFKKYIIDPIATTLRLDGKKIIGKRIIDGTSIDVLTPEFLNFVGRVYGNESLSNLDIKLSYGSVGYESNTNETFTYIDTLFLDKRFSDINENKRIKFYGIKPNSKYVTLHDNNKKFIGDKLDNIHEDPNIKYIIVNNGASLKYGLRVGDRINMSIENLYYRDSEKIYNEILNSSLPPKPPIDILNNSQIFEVIDISSTSFGEEFFISQKNANNILGYDEARYVVNINKTVNGTNTTFTTNTISPTKESDIPFNGIYSNDYNPIILSKALSYYSLINLYGNYFDISNTGMFDRLVKGSDINLIIEAITPRNQLMLDEFNRLNNTQLSREMLKDHILKDNSLPPLIINYLLSNFGEKGITIALKDFSNYYTTQSIYSSLVSTLTLIQNLLVSIIIPLVAIIILIMSSIMLEEIKRMIFIFKTLGYSDRQNIFNIIFNFLPIYLVSIAIGFLVTFLLFLSMQYLIYFLTSIFISSSVNVLNWVYASLAILAIIFVNIIFTIFLYKKDKLSEVMKTNF